MDRQSIINEMFKYLVGIGKIQTQQDLARAIGADPSTISGAMNGNERNLTTKLLKRINYEFGSVFNDIWILTGEGRMLKSNGTSLSIETKSVDTRQISVEVQGMENVEGVITIKLAIILKL